MSTISQLEPYHTQTYSQRPRQAAPQGRLRELWADGLATVAIVTLASTVVFEALGALLR